MRQTRTMNSAERFDEVWVAGDVLIDLIPQSSGADAKRTPVVGGGGANTTKALARLGINTHFIDGISTDSHGQLSRKELTDSGVNLDRAVTMSQPTATAEVTLALDGSAEYRFSLEGTATFDFREDWLRKGEPTVLHLGTLATIIEPGCDALFRWANSIHAPKVFDPNVRPSVLSDRSRYRDKVEKWIAISDVIKFSEDDLFWLYPEVSNMNQAIDFAQEILPSGPSLVVITRGEAGIVGISTEQVIEVSSVAAKIIDTVGAGDTVGAILVEGLYTFGVDEIRGKRLQSTLERAAKAASITCSRAGAQPPKLAELGPLNRSEKETT